MKAASALVIAFGTGLLLLFAPGGISGTASRHPRMYVFNYENVLGTSLEVKIMAWSESQSDQAQAVALAEIDREAAILSSWDPHSEFSRWFRTLNQPVRVSAELYDVFGLFDDWRWQTHGALDASVETITRVWGSAAASHRLPSAAELKLAVAGVRQVHWKLDSERRTATHTSDVSLALNSFVKSYIIERSAEAALRVPGVTAAVVNIGGDLVARGDWTEPVNIADPRADAENDPPLARLTIHDRAVATSGDYRRGVEIAGRRYSHIIDPRTGMPADDIISSTVVAPIATDAGALATAFSVLRPEESRKLAATIPGVEYLLVEKNGVQITSAGWGALEPPRSDSQISMSAPSPPAASPSFRLVSAQAGASSAAPKKAPPAAQGVPRLWDRQFSLTVGIELNLIEGTHINRPYIVVWIEDDNKNAVRTVGLWFNKLRYLNELHEWSADATYWSSTMGINRLTSLGGATRPPGKYTMTWDGRDDFGKYVKAGKYTVLIEAAREKGTYQIMRQEMDFESAPKQAQLSGGIEIASAYLDYHKVTH